LEFSAALSLDAGEEDLWTQGFHAEAYVDCLELADPSEKMCFACSDLSQGDAQEIDC